MRYFLLFVLLCCGCSKSTSNIKFTASSTGSGFLVNYVDGKGNPQTYTGPSPFEETFTANSGAELSISAASGASGTNEVHIYINGADKAHDTETGTKAVARAVVE